MDTTDKVVLSIVIFCLLIGSLIIAFKVDTTKRYSIEIEFTDGTKRTVQFESIERPKVTDGGCLYDHSKKSWICGCRDIQYTECNK